MSLIIKDFSKTHFRVFPSGEMGTEDYRKLFYAMKKPVEGARYMPSYKYGQWDGTIEFLKYKTGLIKLGLFHKTLQLIKDMGIEVQHIDESILTSHFRGENEEIIREWLLRQKVYSKGTQLHPRDYQLDSVVEAIHNKKLLIQSPTSSGKSLIIYFITKFLLETIEGKILIIVPTTNLVNQLYADFADYENVPKVDWADISTDKKRLDNKRVFISTWQTVIRKKEQEWWGQFETLMVDEAHHCKAKSLDTISNNLFNATWRFGFSGSVKQNWKDADFWTIVSQFGKIHTTTTTKELIEEKQIAAAKVELVEIDHKEFKVPKSLDYREELNYICSSPERNNEIERIVRNCEGNVLVLFSLVEKQGKPLFKQFQENFDDREILLVYGDVSADEREEIRQCAESKDGVVILASYQTFSTGVNIKNLHNVIFASPTKSFTRIVQSIGRGLRKANGKESCTIYDLFDLLYGSSDKIRGTNFTYKHFFNRLQIYKQENFPINLRKMKLIPVNSTLQTIENLL